MNLYLDNSNVIELRDLKNSVTLSADTGATVQVTITDAAGAEVSGETWPVVMAHAASGTYRATLSDALAITANRKYLAVVEATGSGGEVGVWSCPVVADVRRCD
jgi:hypothetical protein